MPVGKKPIPERVSTPHAWYLVGSVNGERRVFCVSNIHQVTSTAEAFVRPTCFDLSLYWAEYCKQVEFFALAQPQQVQQKKRIFTPVPRQAKQKKEFLNSTYLPEQKKAFNFHSPALKKKNEMLSIIHL